MAKKRPAGEPAKQPKGVLPAVRGSEEWRAWVDRLCDFDRVPYPVLIDRALAEYAKSVGFKEAPPKR
jgi:hypothetical protein